MKKFLLVLSAVLLFSTQAEARTPVNNHSNFNKPGQYVVVNNYHNSVHQRRQTRPVQQNHHYRYKKDKSGEIAAITIGAVGVVALISALTY